MKNCSKKEVKELLSSLGLIPKKQLGQNFLVCPQKAQAIVELAKLGGKNTVVEIGPGLGCLTFLLQKKVSHLTVIEKDKRLCAYLKDLLDPYKATLLHQDALKALKKISLSDKILVSNLPFEISKRILVEISVHNTPKRAVLGLQKEVVEKLFDEKRSNPLSLIIQLSFEKKKGFIIPRRCFYPSPKVEGGVIVLERRPCSCLFEKEEFWKFLKICFSHPRKKLANNLSSVLKLREKDIDIKSNTLHNYIQCRAEELTLQDFIQLYSFLYYS